jgi:hypothetical protein
MKIFLKKHRARYNSKIFESGGSKKLNAIIKWRTAAASEWAGNIKSIVPGRRHYER